MTDIDAVCEAVVGTSCKWVCDVCRKVTATEDEPCDCRDDDFDQRLATIENAIIAEKNAHLERLLAELAAARPIVEAAKAWREWYPNVSAAYGYDEYLTNLAAAIDAARGKL